MKVTLGRASNMLTVPPSGGVLRPDGDWVEIAREMSHVERRPRLVVALLFGPCDGLDAKGVASKAAREGEVGEVEGVSGGREGALRDLLDCKDALGRDLGFQDVWLHDAQGGAASDGASIPAISGKEVSEGVSGRSAARILASNAARQSDAGLRAVSLLAASVETSDELSIWINEFAESACNGDVGPLFVCLLVGEASDGFLCLRWCPGWSWRDWCEEVSFREARCRGGRGKMHLRQVLPELASHLGVAPKFGT